MHRTPPNPQATTHLRAALLRHLVTRPQPRLRRGQHPAQLCLTLLERTHSQQRGPAGRAHAQGGRRGRAVQPGAGGLRDGEQRERGLRAARLLRVCVCACLDCCSSRVLGLFG